MAALLQNPLIEKRLATLKRFDIWLLASAILLLTVGLLSLYSVDAASPGGVYFRKQLLRSSSVDLVVRLGANAFQDMNFWAATTSLAVITASLPTSVHSIVIVDAAASKEQS